MSAGGPILIVDDDFDVRDTIADILTDEGYEVAAAADGLEALEYLRKNPPPCLILLDWMMPRCDGAQFRAEQRRDAQLAKVPLVLLTADAKSEEKVSLLKADGFLAKPVELDDLLDMVKRFCGC